MPLPALRIRGALAAALVLLLIPGSAVAATKPVDLRILTSAGKTLADFRQYTGGVHVHASHKAHCFGPDNASHNKSYAIGGTTLLGSLVDGVANADPPRPLLLNDAFVDDGFGLGVCGIGGKITPYVKYPATGPYWYSAVNGIATATGPDLIHLKPGDDALWYFATGEESGFPSELELRAPVRTAAETPFPVRVVRVSPSDGSTSPLEGASVTGATNPTDSDGHTTIPASAAGMLHLVATGGPDDVPSAVADVCVDADPANCPAARSLTIFGTGRADRIHGGRGWDSIDSGGGDDVIDIGQGGHDAVTCGGGHDKVIGAGSGDDVKASCEVTKS